MNELEQLHADIRHLRDRQLIEDTLYRYGSSIDANDVVTLRSVLADDVVGIYDGNEPIVGAEALVAWIGGHIATRQWQHHLLNVYHVDIDGNQATAVTYHTSHQTARGALHEVAVIVARYYDELCREPDGRWVITKKVMEVGWRERRGSNSAVT
jgi:ketosteroid isomerase-like protein